MNSGIRDAHNLAWKLALCVRGELGDGALQSYEFERKPHATALIAMAVNMGRVMMPSSAGNALAVQSAFRVLGMYRPARDYVMQMKYKPQPFYEQGMVAGEAGRGLRGRMFAQPQVEQRDGTRVLLDALLGKGFSIIELDDGALPVAAPRADRVLDAVAIRVIPQDHRFLPRAAEGLTQVRDVTGTIGRLFAEVDVRGAILRPDRYVSSALAITADADEADRSLDTLVRLSSTSHPPASEPRPLDLAIV